MDKFILLCLGTSVLGDLLAFQFAHNVLKEFLIGAIGKRAAIQEWTAIPFHDRFLLKKIRPYCEKEHGLLAKYYSLYRAFLYSAGLKYLLFFLLQRRTDSPENLTNLLLSLAVLSVSLFFCFTFRQPELPHGRAKYRRNK